MNTVTEHGVSLQERDTAMQDVKFKIGEIKMNKWIITVEITHLAMGDYDSLPTIDYEMNCGSVEEHLKQNTCPKKNGKVGDDHYELYVQWDYIVEADSKQEAEDQVEPIEIELKENKELDDYLKSIGITDFDHYDFDGSIINCEELSISKRVNHNDTARTYLDRYSKDPKMKLSTQLAENKPLPICSEMIIVHEKLYYNNH